MFGNIIYPDLKAECSEAMIETAGKLEYDKMCARAIPECIPICESILVADHFQVYSDFTSFRWENTNKGQKYGLFSANPLFLRPRTLLMDFANSRDFLGINPKNM